MEEHTAVYKRQEVQTDACVDKIVFDRAGEDKRCYLLRPAIGLVANFVGAVGTCKVTGSVKVAETFNREFFCRGLGMDSIDKDTSPSLSLNLDLVYANCHFLKSVIFGQFGGP